jgi:hypothetical protein
MQLIAYLIWVVLVEVVGISPNLIAALLDCAGS